MTKKTIPAISIIIPMYNTEKYIGECLDSILAQTFQDFEVIVVDDCSTDKSVEVVESYLPKFNGKLQLVRSKVNSGGCPGIPRNMGIRFSCGEYLMFIDSDDAITNTALEEIYFTAKKFEAEVVHSEKLFKVGNENFTTNTSLLTPEAIVEADFVDNPTFMTEELYERINNFASEKFDWSTVLNFVQRKLVVQNNIKFAECYVYDDVVFAVHLLCSARKFLKVPIYFYIYRQRENSAVHKVFSVEEFVHKDISNIYHLIKDIDKIFDNYVNLINSPYRYALLDMLTRRVLGRVAFYYAKFPIWQLDMLIRREIEQFEDKPKFINFFFDRMNVLQVNLMQQQNLIHQQQAQIQQLQIQLQELKNSK